tara:strand:- start:374 stop:772 length:399 start_codon:yes stop_codon:yes gene_type:complete
METRLIGKEDKFKVAKQYETEGKIFMAGGVVKGTLAEQRRPVEGGKGFQYRKGVVVNEDEKDFFIPLNFLDKYSEIEETLQKEVKDLQNQLSTVIEKAEQEGLQVMDKKYFGFTGKQLAVGALVLLLVLKIK